jgi:hypothetical protein
MTYVFRPQVHQPWLVPKRENMVRGKQVISPGKAITKNMTSSIIRKKNKAPRIKYKKDQEHQYSWEKKPPRFLIR